MNNKRAFQLISISLIAVMYFFVNVQRVAIPSAIFNTLQYEFSAKADQITALGAMLMYIYAFMQLVLGVLVDKFGGKNVIKIGSLFFCLGSLLFAFANNLSILYFSRMLVAVGLSTYYLSLISELKQTVAQKNYALVLSVILAVGYFGGIFASAPFVVMSNAMGWREALGVLAMLSVIFSVVYWCVADKGLDTKQKKKSDFKFSNFFLVARKHENIKAIIYACSIYGSYYVLQTVIGNKFLQDYCQFSLIKASSVMSLTALFYAFSGIVLAFLSKEIYHRKILFLRIVSSLNLILLSLICVFLYCGLKTPIIAVFLCVIALGSSISSLLVPFLQEINDEYSSTAISLMVFLMYVTIGLLDNLCGYFLNLFPSENFGNIIVYSKNSYLALFTLLTILVLIALISVFRLKESPKIRKLIGIYAHHD